MRKTDPSLPREPGVPMKSRGSTRKRVPEGADFMGWEGGGR